MLITAQTRIGELLDAHPSLVEFLISRYPTFSKLKNPLLRKTVAKIATLSAASAMAGVTTEQLVREIQEFLAGSGGAAAPQLSREERIRVMKEIILELHAGGNFKDLKERFSKMSEGLEHSDIAEMEQRLIKEGMPETEIKRLCDIHVAMFQDSLKEQEAPKVPKGHPLYWFMEENRALENLLVKTEGFLNAKEIPQRAPAALTELFQEISNVHIHYARKENQLFSLLERHGVDAPSKVMWSLDDDIRALIKGVIKESASLDFPDLKARALDLFQKLRDMITKEERILFPLSLDTLSGPEWQEMKRGDKEIGYAWINPGDSSTENSPAAVGRNDGLLALETGGLSGETVNLILNHLPIEFSFVDEKDEVLYYNQGLGERIFPRSPAVIGRKVQNCHPPKSLGTVEKILSEFKSGAKSVAEFWMERQGRFLHIRYLAVRDKENRYKGTLEITQDITALRTLTGEKRLLDWKS